MESAQNKPAKNKQESRNFFIVLKPQSQVPISYINTAHINTAPFAKNKSRKNCKSNAKDRYYNFFVLYADQNFTIFNFSDIGRKRFIGWSCENFAVSSKLSLMTRANILARFPFDITAFMGTDCTHGE